MNQLTLTDRLSKFTAVFFVIGIGIRLAGANVISYDMRGFLLPWYDFITAHDWLTALRGEFSNYTPSYIYLLTLVAKTNVLFTPVAAIKLLSVLFDFINAFLVYRIVGLRGQGRALPLLAAGLFLCLPTPAMNSAAWGQTDATYTCFMLAGLYCLLLDRPVPAMTSFGVALAFKAQSLLFAPFVLLLTIRRRIPWWTYVLVPAVYLAFMLPAVLAGRSIASVLGVYLVQARTNRALSMFAPNLYMLRVFFPDSFYAPALVIGFVIAASLATAWVVVCARRLKEMTAESLILCATVCVATMPFLLPKMHDRFFYLMDVLTFLTVFFLPHLWMFAVAAQVASGLVYLSYLFFPPEMSFASPGAILVALAVLVNTFAICFLVRRQWLIMTRHGRDRGAPLQGAV